ncbi:MAG: hypothetical protein AABM43_10390 [Actinomycetota bacterium]
MMLSRSLRRLDVVLGLAFVGLVSAPSALAAQLDTATATGSSSIYFRNINIIAQSGTSGQNPSGTGSFTVNGQLLSGTVSCLSVMGPDMGAGKPGSPTIAVLNLQGTTLGVVTVELVDNGGNGADIFSAAPGVNPTDCSPLTGGLIDTLTNGRAIVFDAATLPISKDQCKNGGWMTFPQFKNQGDCVSFLAKQGENQPG